MQFTLLVFRKTPKHFQNAYEGEIHLHTAQLCCHFVFLQVEILGTQIYTPGVDFLDRDCLYLKNSHQDLSYEGSNFILSLLEVGR